VIATRLPIDFHLGVVVLHEAILSLRDPALRCNCFCALGSGVVGRPLDSLRPSDSRCCCAALRRRELGFVYVAPGDAFADSRTGCCYWRSPILAEKRSWRRF
jgi:hypothetical protein